MPFNAGYSSQSDAETSEGGRSERHRRRRSKRSEQQIAELEDVKNELRRENSQLRAQLLEQQEIISKEFRRRMTQWGISVHEEDDASDENDSQNDALRVLTLASAKQHENITAYQSRYEKSQRELSRLMAGTATLKKRYADTQLQVLSLEKSADVYSSETEGLRERLCDAMQQVENLEIALNEGNTKIQELTDQLAATETELKNLQQSSSQMDQTEKYEQELGEKQRIVESQRTDLLKKIERIAHLEEEVEKSQHRSRHANMLREMAEENRKLANELTSLSEILNQPENNAKVAVASLMRDLDESKQEILQLRKRNQILVENESKYEQSIKELEHKKEILAHEVNSLRVECVEMERQISMDTLSTKDTNSLTSSIRYGLEGYGVFVETEETISSDNEHSKSSGEGANTKSTISSRDEALEHFIKDYNDPVCIFEDTDDTSTFTTSSSVDASSFTDEACGDAGSSQFVTELLQEARLLTDAVKLRQKHYSMPVGGMNKI